MGLLTFLMKMHSASDEVSSKRVYATMVLLLVTTMVVGDQFLRYKLDFAVLVSLITLFLTLNGLNTLTTVKSMEVKENVATGIIDAEKPGAGKEAREVLEGNKP